LLLKNWDLEKFAELKDRSRARQIADKLGPDQKMRILEQVAAAIQHERTGLEGNLISEDRLKEITQRELSQLGVYEPWSVAGDLIWMLRERNFMLAYMGDHQYAFVHRTFLEYFCARDFKFRLERTSGLSVRDVRQIFKQSWAKDEWHEILKLLSGMIGAEYAGECVGELLLHEKQREGHRAVLLAAQCLQEVRELGIVRTLHNEVKGRLIRLMHLEPSRYYRAWEEESVEVAPISVLALQELARGWKQDPNTLLMLKRAADDEDWEIRRAAIQELARGWKDDPDTLPLLKDRATQDEDDDVRQAAVQELARGGKDDPDTLPLLKDRATQDEDNGVRLAAIQELVRRWKDDPDTLPLVKDRAAHDEDGRVRQAVVQELVRGWKDELDTLGLLKRSAYDDDEVRQAAVQELALGWKDDPDTLPLLKDRAVHDDDGDVRKRAIQLLVRRWKDNPDTLAFLTDRAEHDEDNDVRQTVRRELDRIRLSESRNVV
jgi:predicted NACHT family NTPase